MKETVKDVAKRAATGEIDVDWALVTEGLSLMVVGMLTVFAFLLLLVGCIEVSGRLVRAWAPPTAPAPAHVESQDQDVEIAVVIAAAEAWRRQQGE